MEERASIVMVDREHDEVAMSIVHSGRARDARGLCALQQRKVLLEQQEVPTLVQDTHVYGQSGRAILRTRRAHEQRV